MTTASTSGSAVSNPASAAGGAGNDISPNTSLEARFQRLRMNSLSPTSAQGQASQRNGNALSPAASAARSASEDLWDQALERFRERSDTDRKRADTIRNFGSGLSNARLTGEQLVNELKTAVEKKQREAEQRARKFTIGNNEYVARKVGQRIIDCLNTFKDFGDIAVQIDPVHASLPWAAFRFLLTAATVTSQQAGEILVGIQGVVHDVVWCKVIECQHLGGRFLALQNTRPLNLLRESIIDLYVAILAFLGLAIHSYQSKSARNTIHRIFHPKELSEHLSEITQLRQRVDQSAASCQVLVDEHHRTDQSHQLKQLQHYLDIKMESLERDTTQLVDIEKQREDLQILRSISSIPYETDLDNAREGRLPGTCEWLLTEEKYLTWRDARLSTVFWLHGILGAGKTKLVTKVIDELSERKEQSIEGVGLAYFFCAWDREDHRSPVQMLQSMIRQLSWRPGESAIRQCTRDVYDSRKSRNFPCDQFTISQCQALLLDLANSYQDNIIVIDGLDECEEGDRAVILESLDRLIKGSSSVVKIFIACRNDRDLVERYALSASIDFEIMPTHNQDDIEKLVALKLSQNLWAKTKLSARVREQIDQVFREKSEGMFQWASLHIEELLRLRSDRDIEKWLEALPRGLIPAYDRIFQHIDPRQLEYVDRALQWLMVSWRPLTPEELVLAAQQDPDNDFDSVPALGPAELLPLCRNLVVVVPDSIQRGLYAEVQDDDPPDAYVDEEVARMEKMTTDELEEYIVNKLGPLPHAEEEIQVCRLSHLSVHEYLSQHRYTCPKARLLVFKACLRYWIWESKPSSYEVGTATFKDYCAELFRHLEDPTDAIVESSWPLICQFTGTATKANAPFNSWFNHVQNNELWPSSENHSILLSTTVWDIDIPLAQRQPAVVYIVFGVIPVIKYWVENGMLDPNFKLRYSKGVMSLLTLSALSNHLFACTLLLDHGADIDFVSGKIGTALHAAVIEIARWRIVKLLLGRGAKVDIVNGGGETPLILSARLHGDRGLPLTRLLLEHGANVNFKSKTWGSAIQAAASGRPKIRTGTLDLLLRYGADVNMTAPHRARGTALQEAVVWAATNKDDQSRGDTSVIQYLLDNGADVNLVDGFWGTALNFAASVGSTTVVSCLLSNGADVNLIGGFHRTALEAALCQGDQCADVVHLLISHGAKVNHTPDYYWVPIETATRNGFMTERVVALLVAQGADLQLSSLTSRTNGNLG